MFVPSFTLESGITLHKVPVAYQFWGALSKSRDNVLVVCHAMSGSADIATWWGPLLGGDGQAFDTSRFFIICLNSLGSPYGSASPLTHGGDFPKTTIRDDVRLHKIILDTLGIKSIAAVIGGSMGGMLALEWAYFGPQYVRAIVPIATAAQQGAWGISANQAQRQSIFADAKFNNGNYSLDDPPINGLAAARMAALMTYRTRKSFELRFGRRRGIPEKRKVQFTEASKVLYTSGEATNRMNVCQKTRSLLVDSLAETTNSIPVESSCQFSAQSYLDYQGKSFVDRFDSNCYISITHKLDSHDITRDRSSLKDPEAAVAEVLSLIQQPALVIGINSDTLYPLSEQQQLAAGIPNSRLKVIESIDGHDAFLIESQKINEWIVEFWREVLPELMQ